MCFWSEELQKRRSVPSQRGAAKEEVGALAARSCKGGGVLHCRSVSVLSSLLQYVCVASLRAPPHLGVGAEIGAVTRLRRVRERVLEALQKRTTEEAEASIVASIAVSRFVGVSSEIV